jgi:hypothetical protein
MMSAMSLRAVVYLSNVTTILFCGACHLQPAAVVGVFFGIFGGWITGDLFRNLFVLRVLGSISTR